MIRVILITLIFFVSGFCSVSVRAAQSSSRLRIPDRPPAPAKCLRNDPFRKDSTCVKDILSALRTVFPLWYDELLTKLRDNRHHLDDQKVRLFTHLGFLTPAGEIKYEWQARILSIAESLPEEDIAACIRGVPLYPVFAEDPTGEFDGERLNMRFVLQIKNLYTMIDRLGFIFPYAVRELLLKARSDAYGLSPSVSEILRRFELLSDDGCVRDDLKEAILLLFYRNQDEYGNMILLACVEDLAIRYKDRIEDDIDLRLIGRNAVNAAMQRSINRLYPLLFLGDDRRDGNGRAMRAEDRTAIDAAYGVHLARAARDHFFTAVQMISLEDVFRHYGYPGDDF